MMLHADSETPERAVKGSVRRTARWVPGSERGYRFLIDHSKEIILVLNAKAKIIFANQRTMDNFGYSEEELVGKSITRFLAKGSIRKALLALAQEFLGRAQPELELQAKTKSGEVRHLSVAEGSAPIRENGRLIGLMVSASDITEQKKAEHALRESEKNFRDLWENAPVAYQTMDTIGIIIDVNSTETKMLGYSKDELVGKSIFEFILPEQRAEAVTRFQQKISGHRIPRVESRVFIKKDGSKINVGIDDSLKHDGNGKVIGVRTTMVDITKIKIAEESLKKSEEHFRALVEKSGIAISINDEKGNLLYGNSRYADNFGYSIEEMRGQPISSIVHSDDVERVMAYHAGRLQGKDVPSRYEFKGIRKDGSVIYLEVDVSVLREEDRLIGARSYMWDITDRTLAEEKLRKRRAWLELVHHIQSEIPMSDDIDAVLNQTAESIGKTFGYYKISVNLYARATNEIEYLTGWNKTGLSLPRGHRQQLGQGLIGKAGLLKQTILANDVSKEPDYIPYLLTETKAELVIPLLVENHLIGVLDLQATEVEAFSKEDIAVLESVASYIAFIIDRKKREEALQESEEKFRNLAEQSPNMIFINQRGRVVYANKKCEEIMGYKKEEIYSPDFDFLALIAPEFRDEIKTRFLKHINGVENDLLQYSLLTKEGKRIEVILNSKLIDYEKDKAILGIVTDISERMRAEEELRKSEAKLKEAQALGRIGNWEFDLDKQTNQWSDQVYRLYERDPSIGPPNVEEEAAYYSPEQAERLHEYARIAAEQGQAFEYDLEARLPSGRVAHLAATLRPIKDESGRIAKLIGTVQDITERKRAEGMLGKSEKRFRQLSDLLPQIVFETDIRGNLTFANQFGLKLFGYSHEDFQSGLNIFALVVPDDRESIKSRLKEILSGSGATALEYCVMRKDGGKFPILMHATAILEEGVPVGVRGIAIDITERKRAEEALQESEEKYRTLVENAAEAILIAQDGMLKFVNHTASEITGYSEKELRSSPFLEFVHPDDRKMVGERYMRRLKGDMSLPRYAFRLMNKDGSITWMEIDAVLVAWEGKPATLNFLSDITERKRAGEELKNSEERLKIMFEYAPDAYYLNDLKGNFIDGNKAAEKLLGLNKAELIGKSFLKLDLLSLDQIPKAASLLARNAMGRPTGPDEFTLKKKDRTEVAVEISTHPVKINGKTLVLGIARDISESKRIGNELQQTTANLRKSLGSLISLVTTTVELRDPYTSGHQKRVSDLARRIASTMGLPKDQIEGIRTAGVVHDIGKISIPAEILSKPGRLNAIELSLIRTHAEIGYRILKDIEFPWPVAQIVYQHHERMDGSGYPQGLKGGEILPESRILAVADVVEAMASYRPYRPALGIDKALAEINQKKGILYDPEVAEACMKVFIEQKFTFNV